MMHRRVRIDAVQILLLEPRMNTNEHEWLPQGFYGSRELR